MVCKNIVHTLKSSFGVAFHQLHHFERGVCGLMVWKNLVHTLESSFAVALHQRHKIERGVCVWKNWCLLHIAAEFSSDTWTHTFVLSHHPT